MTLNLCDSSFLLQNFSYILQSLITCVWLLINQKFIYFAIHTQTTSFSYMIIKRKFLDEKRLSQSAVLVVILCLLKQFHILILQQGSRWNSNFMKKGIISILTHILTLSYTRVCLCVPYVIIKNFASLTTSRNVLWCVLYEIYDTK